MKGGTEGGEVFGLREPWREIAGLVAPDGANVDGCDPAQGQVSPQTTTFEIPFENKAVPA
ncbi:MAG: hypothetical protein ACO3OO_08430 [Gemmobacter sp.]